MDPIIKCPGGKKNLLPVLLPYFPNLSYSHYVEPFFGGGAVFFDLMDNLNFVNKNIYINDYNFDIYNLYYIIQNNFENFIKICSELQKQTGEEVYYRIRNEFNNIEISRPNINRAAQFLYLNKNCFNGLIRYNKSGKYNSPYGSYKTPPKLYDYEKISLIHSLLKKMRNEIQITNWDFELLLKSLLNSKLKTESVFVYLDPPYIPVSKTSSFVDYSPGGFGIDDQKRIAKILSIFPSSWKFILSNSNSPLTKEIFKCYDIIEIEANRSISANGESRKKIKEVIIKNF